MKTARSIQHIPLWKLGVGSAYRGDAQEHGGLKRWRSWNQFCTKISLSIVYLFRGNTSHSTLQLWSDGITFYAQHVMLECRVKRFQTQEYDHTKHFRGLELEGISRFDNNLSNPKFPQFLQWNQAKSSQASRTQDHEIIDKTTGETRFGTFWKK